MKVEGGQKEGRRKGRREKRGVAEREQMIYGRNIVLHGSTDN